jgi:tRNA synthetases class I (E and Q), anti-codon binding domain
MHPQGQARPKGTLSWVPVDGALPVEVRLYGHLFTVPSPDANWEAQLNAESEVTMHSAQVTDSAGAAQCRQRATQCLPV